ncbi:hypothetical protein NKT77_01930 [Moraxella sp. FZLJ2107]|uniref:hypothetical protein n=1 Tax=unclassified Moraxella TaxID=2685852 RepID=UPI0020C8CA32|nr:MULTISPECIES: hypothetical protein [unclassified Moraxella]UTO05439.1 hypothetical protein NKT77_01930 [Moraxella sp. FZLJ2107]UTO22175.1 hypothetical protein NKU06_10235 [Moraxella sp. FZLJ2109]
MMNIKILLHAIVFSTWIITNFYKVSVLSGMSIYTFIWSWCFKSIANVFGFFYLGFLLNLMVVVPIVYFLLMINKRLKEVLLKKFKLIFFVSLFFVILSNIDFIVFDVRFYPFNPSVNEITYCEYHTYFFDDYLKSGGCIVPD